MTNSRSFLVALVMVSGLAAAVASGWLTGVLANPMMVADDALALLVLPQPGLAGLVLGGAVLGVVSGLVLLAPGVRGDRRLLVAAAVLQLLVFGIAVQGISTIALAGYLVALALPAAAVVLSVQVVRRYPRLRAVVALAVLAVGVWSALTGVFRPDRLWQLGANLSGGFATAAPQLLTSLLFTALAVGWAMELGGAIRRTPAADPLRSWVLRHRRALTVVAALGPAPYALARATWLTPWPQFGGPIEDLPPETRLWGLLLGAAAVTGIVLTLGLIRPWGEVFPRWMPGLAGRPVPVAMAAIPGGAVAAILTLSAVPMMAAMLSGDLDPLTKTLTLVLFPFAVWGPALALAVWGYVAHRSRDRVRVPETLAR